MYLRRYSLGRSVLSLGGALVTLISIFPLLQPPAQAARHNSSLLQSCGTIQCAIDAAPPGSTLLIPAGQYTESLTLNKPVSLTGVSSATVIIHAVTGQRVLTVTGSAISNTVIISGLTFTGGSASNGYIGPDLCGGGIFIGGAAQPLLQHVSLTDNYAGYEGGGVYADNTSTLILIDVQVISNTSGTYGAGAYAGGPAQLAGSRFENNHCTWSGCGASGLSTWSNLTMTDTIFVNNWGNNGGCGANLQQGGTIVDSRFENNHCVSGAGLGGGLAANGTLTLIEVEFISNTAAAGGGLYTGGVATVIGGRFLQNQATLYGGGLWANYGSITINGAEFLSNTAATDGGGFLSRVNTNLMNARLLGNTTGGRGGGAAHIPTSGGPAFQMRNSVFANNVAGSAGAGLYLASAGQTQILNSTFAGLARNSNQAISIFAGTVNITNTILASYTLGISRTGGTVTEDYNLFYGNTTDKIGTINGGTHDVSGDPIFVDPASDNYHLGADSAAIDKGIDAGLITDFDGDVRPQGNGIDLGYDEVLQHCSLSPNTDHALGNPAVTLNFSTMGNVDCVAAVYFPRAAPHATGTVGHGVGADHFWQIAARNVSGQAATGFTASITVPYSGFTNPLLCFYPGALGGAGWDCTGTQTYDASTITRQGITHFSDWAVGNEVGPTAVTLQSISVHDSYHSISFLAVLLMALDLVGVFIMWRYSHKSIESK
jgi:hypothetical protein